MIVAHVPKTDAVAVVDFGVGNFLVFGPPKNSKVGIGPNSLFCLHYVVFS